MTGCRTTVVAAAALGWLDLLMVPWLPCRSLGQAKHVQRALYASLASAPPKTQAQLLTELQARLRGALPPSPLLPKPFSEIPQLHARCGTTAEGLKSKVAAAHPQDNCVGSVTPAL